MREKEFMVFVGPSGCGKTTTLRMVAGLESITSGRILIDDKVINELPPMDRDIAMVFQNYALYPHMSVYDNMAFGLKMRKFDRADIARRVQEAAEILGIQELLKRKPRQLSGGQRQRVALGRAIVRHPQVFLFDEPLSNLDAKLRVQMRVELKKLHERLGTTAIYVTHDQVESMTLSDRDVVMRDGWAASLRWRAGARAEGARGTATWSAPIVQKRPVPGRTPHPPAFIRRRNQARTSPAAPLGGGLNDGNPAIFRASWRRCGLRSA